MDLIDRQAVIDALKLYCIGCNNYNGVKCRACQIADCIDTVDDAPTAQPTRSEIRRMAIQQEVFKPKHGKWIDITVEWVDDVKFVLAKCSVCGNRIITDMEQLNDTIKFARNFCGCCGADMRGEEDDKRD